MRSIAFSPDGRTFLTASHKSGLDFWDLRGQRQLSHVDGLNVTEPAWRFGKAVYLARDQGLALATQDHGVVFTDGRGTSHRARSSSPAETSKPLALADEPSGQEIAVGWTDGGGITVHDVASGTLLRRFDGFDNAPFAISPDGRWFVRQESADVVLYPIGSQEPGVVLGHHGRFRTLAFSSDGALLAGACYDHTTVLWDVARRKQFSTLRGHRQRVINVAFSPDGEWIATTSGDYTTRIWETRTGQTLATLPGSGDMGQVAWSPDGNYLAVITYWFSTVFIYRIAGRHDVQQWLPGNGAEAVVVASHPHREQFTTIFANGELLTVDAAASRPEHRRIGKDPGQASALAYSADGKRLATGSWSVAKAQTILVRNVESGEIICQIQSSHFPTALASRWVRSAACQHRGDGESRRLGPRNPQAVARIRDGIVDQVDLFSRWRSQVGGSRQRLDPHLQPPNGCSGTAGDPSRRHSEVRCRRGAPAAGPGIQEWSDL